LLPECVILDSTCPFLDPPRAMRGGSRKGLEQLERLEPQGRGYQASPERPDISSSERPKRLAVSPNSFYIESPSADSRSTPKIRFARSWRKEQQ
jgi:hypothetical protein